MGPLCHKNSLSGSAACSAVVAKHSLPFCAARPLLQASNFRNAPAKLVKAVPKKISVSSE